MINKIKFINEPFIQKIKENESWTVSDKEKRPINIRALLKYNQFFLASHKTDDWNPCVRLTDILNSYNTSNLAYRLDSVIDNFYCIDIEKTCPESVVNTFLNETPYIYGEVSLSGNGYHLFYDIHTNFDTDLLKKSVIKYKNWYEILFYHYVTFTGKIIKPSSCKTYDKLDKLLSFHKENIVLADKKDIELTDIELDQDKFDLILDKFKYVHYYKTPEMFDNDMSKWEFNLCLYYKNIFKRVTHDIKFQSETEKFEYFHALIKRIIPHRDKHESARTINNKQVTWLYYTCYNAFTI